MKYRVFKAIIALIFVGVLSSPVVAEEKLKKPTIFTNPIKYLKKVPLNKLSADEVIGILGMPDKSNELFGKTYLSYELGEGYGKREFVYEISEGKLTDVRYHDQGPYNGKKASEIQQEKKE